VFGAFATAGTTTLKATSAISGAALAGLLVMCGAAQASITLDVNEAFASGATFTGTVTMTDGFGYATVVDGTLTGYQYGTEYVGAGSDLTDWIWYPGTNFDTNSATTFGTFLMDGPVNGAYSNFITFDLNYANPNHIVFDVGSDILSPTEGGNNVNYQDPLVSGAITVVAVAEPSTWAMMTLGFAGLGFAGYRASRKSVSVAV
jgi:hypothetical protein